MTYSKYILFSLTLVFCFLFCAHAQTQTISGAQQAKIDEILNKYKSDKGPGLGLGIVKKGVIVYEKYIGLADLSHAVPFSFNTRTNIASNAKQFVALMALDLASKNKLDLEQDIRVYFPDLYRDVSHSIKVSSLINHTSGIRDIYDLMNLQGKSWWRSVGLSNKNVINILAKQQDLNFVPETKALYSNSNYILLSEIIAQLTGQPFVNYSASFFQELGMKDTAFVSDYMMTIPNRARPYANWGSWKEYPSLVNVHGDGNLFTTLRDQLSFEALIQNQSSAFLSKSTLAKSQKALNHAHITQYGYGLEFTQYMGHTVIFHNGETGAYKANFTRFPSLDTSIVVISNNAQVYAQGLAYEIADIVIDASMLSTDKDTISTALQINSQPNINKKSDKVSDKSIDLIEPMDLKEYAGTFINDELDLQITIQYIGNDDFLIKRGESESSATFIKPNTLKWKKFKLSPVLNSSAEIEELLLDGDRIKQVSFKRL